MGCKLRVTWNLELGQSPNEKPRYGPFTVATHLKLAFARTYLAQYLLTAIVLRGHICPALETLRWKWRCAPLRRSQGLISGSFESPVYALSPHHIDSLRYDTKCETHVSEKALFAMLKCRR